MSIEKRRFIRFSLDIPAYQFTKNDQPIKIMVRQISVGGCFAELEESVLVGEDFRLELTLPNKNRLPLCGKVIYQYSGKGTGVKFNNISQFEQELLGKIISDSLETEGLPLLVDPFVQPPNHYNNNSALYKDNKPGKEKYEDELVDEVIASEV